jgi:acyl-CoA thioesterase
MTRDTKKPTAMETLVATLDLEPIEVDIFRGTSPQVGWQRVFGGQVIAQALMAAQRTVEPDAASAFAACLFHATRRSVGADHLSGRAHS